MLQLIYKQLNRAIMSTRELSKLTERAPHLFDNFFKPWNEWFNNGTNFLDRIASVPSVNITEQKDAYLVSLAAPGLKNEDFKIDMEGNMLTISCENEESKEEKEEKFTRKEYSYSSFSRSFTLPDNIKKEQIEAKYEDGVLKITLPSTEVMKNNSATKIAVK